MIYPQQMAVFSLSELHAINVSSKNVFSKNLTQVFWKIHEKKRFLILLNQNENKTGLMNFAWTNQNE